MPFDAIDYSKIDYSTFTPAEKLRVLADFIETLPAKAVDMHDYHCGTAACALGWAERIGMIASAEREHISCDVFGLYRYEQIMHAFGCGEQFHYLNRPYTPADVARHLRETAAELEADHV